MKDKKQFFGYNFLIIFITLTYVVLLPFIANAQSSQDSVELNSYTVQTKDGAMQGDKVTGTVNNFFQLQKNVVFNVMKQVGIKEEDIPADILQAIKQPHTKNFDAFVQYSKGLDYLDKGKYSDAESSFQKAIALDPNFDMALDAVKQVPLNMSSIDEISANALAEATSVSKLSTVLIAKGVSIIQGAGPGSSKLSEVFNDIGGSLDLESTLESTRTSASQTAILQEGDLKLNSDPTKVNNLTNQLP